MSLIVGGTSYLGAAIIGGSALAGGYMSSKASSNAADAQTQAANQANQTQQAMYDQTRTDNMPWHDAGVTALNQLSTGTQPGGQFMHSFNAQDFVKDPGYAFRIQQGQDALDNSAAAHGSLLSGAQIKASTDYNQNFASNEYSNAYNRFNTDRSNQFNRLSGVAGTGQTANNLVGQIGMGTANQISSNTLGAGNARASGYMGQANALTGAIGTGINGMNQYNAMQQANLYGSPMNFGGGYNPNGSFSPNTYGTGQTRNALSNGSGYGIE